jgi:hypothetical protein
MGQNDGIPPLFEVENFFNDIRSDRCHAPLSQIIGHASSSIGSSRAGRESWDDRGLGERLHRLGEGG